MRLRSARPTSLAGRLFLALLVMLLPVAAVAAINVVTFRASVTTLEEFMDEGVKESRAIGGMRSILVMADDIGERYVETGGAAAGERLVAISDTIEAKFGELGLLLDTATERKLGASALLHWEDAFEAATKAVSGPPDVRERELDRFHDSLDEAVSVTADLYRVNVDEIAVDISSLRAQERWQFLAGLAILAVSAIGALVIGSLLRRAITKPLLLLEEAATEVGSDNLSHRIQVDGEDELANVSNAFNSMADRLERSRDEQIRSAAKIERLNVDLERRVAARTADLESAMHDLKHAKQTAEEANRVKSDFLSRTSHELRTPLNVILGFGQLLESSALPPADRESVQEILRASRRLLNLINDVLDIAHFDSGRLSLSPVCLAEVVAETLDLVRPLAVTRGIAASSDEIDSSWYVFADRVGLRRILHNLISNGIYFNRDAGKVIVSAKAASDTVTVDVSDTGPGIAPDDMERLFSPFDRLGAERSNSDGTGLGLALAKALTESMRGTLIVRSEQGEGSTFTLELPRALDPEAAMIGGGDAAPAHGSTNSGSS